MKYNLFSPLLSSVSGDLQVLHVTYSTDVRLVNVPVNRSLGKLADISPQHILNLLLLESTLDDQTSATINGTARTQFSKQVGSDVLISSLHAFANLRNIGENGLLVAFTQTLGRWDLVTS